MIALISRSFHPPSTFLSNETNTTLSYIHHCCTVFHNPGVYPVYPSQRFNYQMVIMRHEQYGLHGTLPHFASRNRNVELLIIQRANVPALRSLIAIDRSELQLGRAQLEAQALESIFGFRQKKIIWRDRIRKHEDNFVAWLSTSRRKVTKIATVSNPGSRFSFEASLSSRNLPLSLLLSLSLPPSRSFFLSPSRLAYRVRFAPGQPLPAFQSTRSTSFRHYTISFGLSAISRSLERSSAARLFARERVFGTELCHTASCPVPDIALPIRDRPFDIFRGNLGHDKRRTH